MNRKLAVITLGGLLLAGCAWVHLTAEGEKVMLLEAERVTHCKKLGNTSVSVTSRVTGFQRDKTKVAEELATLGRNAAAEMGGDTIVAITDIAGGEQTFDVYKCINP